MKLVRDVTIWYLVATSGNKKRRRIIKEINNVLDITEILCLRRKDFRVGALIIHFSFADQSQELDEIGYIL
jgi:hypothetical protein